MSADQSYGEGSGPTRASGLDERGRCVSGASDTRGAADVDLIGIGFGPANLSLAIAVEERNATRSAAERVDARFVETKPAFGWHDGMLLPGTTMQVSFLKDLVSQRSPTSSYTFLNYLHETGRLTDFINLKTFFPTRREFHAYLSWAAARVEAPVTYGAHAFRVDREEGRLVVSVRDDCGSTERITAGAVVFGTGLREQLPEGISAGPRVFHNHRLLHHLDRLPSLVHGRFLVVGAGQSAAEVAAYLHDTYPDAEVHASIRRFGYVPSDDSPYANRIFDPASVDEYYAAPPELKERLLRLHWSTNYAAVDAELIEELYRREYDEKVRGARRLFVHRVTDVARAEEREDAVEITLRDLGERGDTELEVDAAIFATGFEATDPRPLFGTGIRYDAAFDGALPRVARDYSLRLPGLEGRVFLNGGVQSTHGISSSLLSNLAVRAAEILDAVTVSRAQHVTAAG